MLLGIAMTNSVEDIDMVLERIRATDKAEEKGGGEPPHFIYYV